MKDGPKIPVTTRVPVGEEAAAQPSLAPFSQIAPCDDKPAPAGRQQQHLFASKEGNFDD